MRYCTQLLQTIAMTTKEIITALREHYTAAYDSLTAAPDDYYELGRNLRVHLGICGCLKYVFDFDTSYLGVPQWIKERCTTSDQLWWGRRPWSADTHAQYLERVKLRLDILNGIDTDNL